MHEFNVGGKVNQVRFLPDGERLLISVGSGSCDNLMIWHPLEDSRRTLIDSSAGFWWRPERVAMPRQGDCIFIADRVSVRRFHLSEEQHFVWKAGEWVEQLSVSDDGLSLVVRMQRSLRGYDSTGQHLWDIENVYSHFEKPKTVPNLDVIPTQAFELLPIIDDKILWRQDAWLCREFRTIDLLSGVIEPGFIEMPSTSDPQFANSNGNSLLGIGDGYGIHILDAENDWNSSKLFIKDHHGWERFAFFGNQSIGVIPQTGHQIHMYDLQSLEKTQTLKWNIGELTCLDFSPVTGMGVAGSQDGRVMLWDMD